MKMKNKNQGKILNKAKSNCKKSAILVIAALLVLFCVNSAAAQEETGWQHELSLYGWFAGIDGTVHYPGTPGSGQDFSVDAADIIENLKMIFMGGWRSKYNKWSIIADVVYMDVGDSTNKTVTPGDSGEAAVAALDLDISSWLLHGGAGYDVVQTNRGTLAVVGGVRYMTMDVEVEARFQGPGVERSQSQDLLDGFVGLSGDINFNEKWYLPYYADIGTGDSDLSWQLYAGIGYRFGWGNIKLGYRHLSYELDDDFLMQDLALSGPILGVGFTF
jgi:hypothetical protein